MNKKNKDDFSKLINLIFKVIALAMGIAVIVLNILNEVSLKDSVMMLGIGLFCLSMSLFIKEKNGF